ncbi:uncharacterized protein METZ01_LOCUS314528, partial [marine metagenome]
MQKILIVGGAGYIGGHMTDLLKSLNYEVCVYDSLVYESRYLKDVYFINGDIRDKSKLRRVLPKYDLVIWLAALVGDGACAVNPILTNEINYETVKWLVDNYANKIIFTSTCSVYGINNSLINEDSATNPQSVYAETKLKAEQYILDNQNDYIIFRLGTLFGLGDYFSRVRLDLVVNILSKKATMGETLNVFGGEQWRPLLHVKDVANAVIFSLKNDLKGLYNLSYNNYQIKEIANEIKEIIPKTEIHYSEKQFEDLRNYKVN